ncbi:helix-turn-helix domain-containing protein [Streptomyces sp. NPDC093223]|uniref:helix-turn-helix domain-containing protein n=1 Tax=Streptomyces sp. NPDC093223 TaxID=3366033 RepID=UPI0038038B32
MSDDFDPDQMGVFSSDAPPLFTMVPEWITYSGAKPAHREFWTVLASCVNRKRPDNLVWPAGPELADAMGIVKPEQLKPYREALVSIGAIVPKLQRYANGMRQRYVYDVRFHPPAGYTGPRSRDEWITRRKERLAAAAAAEEHDTAAFEKETAGQSGTPKNGGTETTKSGGSGAPKTGRAGAPENGGAKPDQEKPHQQKPQTALPARGAGNGRRPSTGSSARGTSSGSAAASGACAPNGTSARTRGEVLVTEEVQLVLTAFPDALREALVRTAGSDRPKTVITAIQRQLGDGGLVQARRLGARVARRWVTHGYTGHETNGTLASPVGATVAMLKPGPCPVVECEDGKLVDGLPCRACAEREKDRRAAKELRRRAAAAEREAEARRRACPHCKEDRGTAGQPCDTCTSVITSVEREISTLIDQALGHHLALIGTQDDTAVAALRASMADDVATAQRAAAVQGAERIGQLIAGRLAADALVREHKAAREQSARPQQAVALPAPVGRPDPEPEVRIPEQCPPSDGRCPGPNGAGCPDGRSAVGYDGSGLCVRCRTTVLTA